MIKNFYNFFLRNILICIILLNIIYSHGFATPIKPYYVFSFAKNNFLQQPISITADLNTGYIFISDSDSGTVFSFRSTGIIPPVSDPIPHPLYSALNSKPMGMVTSKRLSGDPNIFVMRTLNGNVNQYLLYDYIISNGTTISQYVTVFSSPNSVAVRKDNNEVAKTFYLSSPNPEIKVFDIDGNQPNLSSINLNQNEVATGLNFNKGKLYAAIKNNINDLGRVSIIDTSTNIPINLIDGNLEQPTSIVTINTGAEFEPFWVLDKTKKSLNYYTYNINLEEYEPKGASIFNEFNNPIVMAVMEKSGKIFILDDGGDRKAHILFAREIWVEPGRSILQKLTYTGNIPIDNGRSLRVSATDDEGNNIVNDEAGYGKLTLDTVNCILTLSPGNGYTLEADEFYITNLAQLVLEGGAFQTGLLQLNNGTIKVNQDTTFDVVDVPSLQLINNGNTLQITSGKSLTINSPLMSNGALKVESYFPQQGPQGILQLFANNSGFSGLVEIDEATVEIGANLHPLGTNQVTLLTNATLRWMNDAALDNNFVIGALGNFDTNGHTATLTGNISENGNSSVNVWGDLTTEGDIDLTGISIQSNSKLTPNGLFTTAPTISIASNSDLDLSSQFQPQVIKDLNGSAVDSRIILGDKSLTLESDLDSSYLGTIEGDANSVLKKRGDGNLSLYSNSLSGSTQIEEGGIIAFTNTSFGTSKITMQNNTVLQFGNDNLVINNPLELDSGNPGNDGEAIIDTGGFTSNLNGVITQIGNNVMKLIIEGGGILNLNNVASHEGGTDVINSIVTINSDNNLGAPQSEVNLNNATLKFNNSITLPQTRTLTLSNNTVLDNQNYSVEISGSINGGGILTKQNVGKITFMGDKNFNGTVIVDAGELKVNGDMVNTAVNVQNGATFSGNNTVLSLINRGIVAPGNSIGQIQVLNNFDNTGGIYRCEVNDAEQSDRINVIGNLGATILHGELQVIPMAGNYQLNHPYLYTILTSINPINTTFDTVNFISPLFTYEVIYNLNNVQLRMIRTALVSPEILEGNAGIVKQNLDQIGTLTGTLQTAVNHLIGLNKNQTVDALNRFNAASNVLLTDSLADNFFDLQNTMTNMLHSPLERSAPHSSFKELVKNVTTNFKATMAQLFSSSTKTSPFNQISQSKTQEVPHSFRSKIGQSTVWSYSDIKSLNQKSYTSPGTFLPALKTKMGDTKLGFDHQFTDQVLIGFMAGYGKATYKLNDNYGDGKIGSYHLGAYSSIHITPEFYVDTLISYGLNSLKGTRKINFAGFEAQASQKHHVHQFGGLIDTGYEMYLPSKFILTPMLGFGILSLKEEGYREIGADTLGLDVKGQRRMHIQNKFGLQLAKYFKAGETQFYGFIRGSYIYRRGLRNAHKVTSSFIGKLSSFTVVGDKQNHNFFSPAAGLTALFENDVYVSLGYNGDLGKKQKSHEGLFKIGYKF